MKVREIIRYPKSPLPSRAVDPGVMKVGEIIWLKEGDGWELRELTAVTKSGNPSRSSHCPRPQ